MINYLTGACASERDQALDTGSEFCRSVTGMHPHPVWVHLELHGTFGNCPFTAKHFTVHRSGHGFAQFGCTDETL